MALTTKQLTWLSKDNIRVILVEAEYNVDTFPLYCNNHNTLYPATQPWEIFCNTHNTLATLPKMYCNTTAVQTANESLYLANTPYVTDGTSFDDVAGNSVSNIGYVDVLDNIPSISSSIDGSTSTSSIQFLNTLGEYDFVFDRDNYAFEGQEVKILIGDPTWPRDEFITVFTGIIDTVTSPTTNSIEIGVRDRKDIFNRKNIFKTISTGLVSSLVNSATQFTEQLVNFPRSGDEGGDIPLNYEPAGFLVPDAVLNSPVPHVLGKCYNVEPVLIDRWNHVYMVNDGPITSVGAVRSNGVLLDGVSSPPDLQYEVDEAIGCIRLLNHDNATKITCDVVGGTTRGKGYSEDAGDVLTAHTIPWLIEWLILEETELIALDIDYTSFTTFSNTDEVGLNFKDDADISSLMTALTSSAGGFYRFNRDNKVQLTILEDPDTLGTPTVTIDQDSIVRNGISLQDVEYPNTEISLGYLKNWTVLSSSEQAGILLEELDSLDTQQQLASEYTIIKTYNGGLDIKARYPLAQTSDLIETLIWDATDAENELDRRATIRSELRHIFRVNSVLNPMELSVGDTVTVIHDRFDLSAGKPMVILSMNEKLSSNRVDLELWR